MEVSTKKSYGIGAVVRHSGVSAPTIRIWEKRYDAVVPERTASNRRLYSAEDLERLSLLRALTEHGHSISTIANLSLEELQGRLSDVAASRPMPGRSNGEVDRKRVLTVGSGLDNTLSESPILDLDLVGQFADLAAAAAAPGLPSVDLIVAEVETLFPESIATIREVVTRAQSPLSILVYRFTASKTVSAMAKAIPGLRLLRAPIRDEQLRRECLVHLQALDRPNIGVPIDSSPPPERLYTSTQLAQLARISTTVECECPQHLAGLLQSLAAFEKYSRECEDRNPQDALLHAVLHRTTAKARRSMEEALQHLVQCEGITLD